MPPFRAVRGVTNCQGQPSRRDGRLSRCDFLPGHPKVAALVATCLPDKEAGSFTLQFMNVVQSFRSAKDTALSSPAVSPDETTGLGYLVRSPVDCIEKTEDCFPFTKRVGEQGSVATGCLSWR